MLNSEGWKWAKGWLWWSEGLDVGYGLHEGVMKGCTSVE